MTHPTYTHPGANAALLALSRARNSEARAIRALNFFQNISSVNRERLCVICRRSALNAKRAQHKALFDLMKINYRHDPVNAS